LAITLRPGGGARGIDFLTFGGGTIYSIRKEPAMNARCCVVVAAFLIVSGALGAEDSKKNDADKVQGEWTVASMELRGKVIEEEQRKDWQLIVKDDEWLQRSKKDNNTNLKMTFKVDPAKNPKEIDFRFTNPEGKEETLKGIYKLDGNTLTVCKRTVDNEDRPKEFKAGNSTLLAVYKRAAKK
jgi:uncharacterized protein (TIGR03067 family)